MTIALRILGVEVLAFTWHRGEEPTEPLAERTPLGVEVGFPTEHPPDFDPPRHLGF